MLFDLPEPVPDYELVAVLHDAFRAGGGRISHELSGDLASIGAEHLVERMRLKDIRAVRVLGCR